MSKLAEEINEKLIKEYISKVRYCDECFASVYCTVNGLRESRVPQDYCVKNIKSYFGDEANLMESVRRTGSWIDGGDCKICSVCGDKSPRQLTHYCANCGAKMLDIM